MALLTRKIKGQIRSIKNTQKITKAMEMVAAAKMRKAVNAVLSSRPYSKLAWSITQDLSKKTDRELHPLLAKRETVERIGIVLVSANRGLCGIFNQQVAREAIARARKEHEVAANAQIEFVTLGKKGATVVAKAGLQIGADFEKLDTLSSFNEIATVASFITSKYLNKEYDKVLLIFTDFINSLRQKPNTLQLLPLIGEPTAELGAVGQVEKTATAPIASEYLFEPSPDVVLESFLPHLVEIQLYQAVLESNASEHSARMVAMKNATDAARDLISDLTLSFNKARQAAITQEISEISVSKAAMEG